MSVEIPGFTPPGKLVDIGGYRLHLHCTGKGNPTVVLIAGGGDFSFDWSLVQPNVSRFARVCSYDRAGLAWSDPGPTPRTMRQDAHELHTLLSAAQIQAPYVLVGHSMGGLIARVYAAQYPNEVAGMVLVDATHEDTTLLFQGKLARMRELAKDTVIPVPQTMQSSPPKPPTAEDIEQFQSNQRSQLPVTSCQRLPRRCASGSCLSRRAPRAGLTFSRTSCKQCTWRESKCPAN
jgi:pimeloyl-ACP methyl ester carboxylesterase